MNSWIQILSAVLILATFLIALYENEQALLQIANATTSVQRKKARAKQVLIWSSPAIAAILTVVSQISSAQADQEIATLKGILAPRTVSPEQKGRIVAELKPYSQERIRVSWSPPLAKESQSYAESLANTLIEAGFSAECVRENSYFPEGQQGTLVSYGTKPDQVENVRRIRAAFSKHGIHAQYDEIPEMDKAEGPKIIIFVIARSVY